MLWQIHLICMILEYSKSRPAQSTNYMGSNTATSYFLYETTYAVNPLVLNWNYEEEQLWRFENLDRSVNRESE